MIPVDKKGIEVKPGDVAIVIGRVERVDKNDAFVKIRDGLVVYVPPEALEVVK